MSEHGAGAAPPQITIVGAGIVGICCALYLQRDGLEVLLIDRDEPGQGASYGNAGILSAASVAPEGEPGLWKRVPGMLLDPLGPLTIRPAYLPRLAPWLLRFLRQCRPERQAHNAAAMAALCKRSIEHYLPLIEDAGATNLVHRNGCLHVYRSPTAFAHAKEMNETRIRFGIASEILEAEEIRQMVGAFKVPFAWRHLCAGLGSQRRSGSTRPDPGRAFSGPRRAHREGRGARLHHGP